MYRNLFYSLVIVTLGPPFFSLLVNKGSAAYGFVFAYFILLVANLRGGLKLSISRILCFLMVIGVVLYHYLFVSRLIYLGHDDYKSLVSLVLLTFCVLAGTRLLTVIGESDITKVVAPVRFVLLIFYLNVCIFLLGIDFYKFTFLSKTMGIFSEPSYYGLSVIYPLSLLIFNRMVSNFEKFLHLGLLFLLGFYVQNFTIILIGFALILILVVIYFSSPEYYKRFASKRLYLSVLIVLALVVIVFVINSDPYYSSRLPWNSESYTNLTRLVWLQGWEQAGLGLIQTNYLGLGFQSFGLEHSGDLSERIVEVLGVEKNRQDGGSLAPKIIGELGFIGVVFIGLFVFGSMKLLFKYMREQSLGNLKLVSMYGIYLTLFFELFIRSSGYYSNGFVLFLSALIVRRL